MIEIIYMQIANVDIKLLKDKYQTPLYVYDEDAIRLQCQRFINNFKHKDMKTSVIYASKAFLTIGMVQLIESEGLMLDCVSQGEVYTALKAGFDPKNIVLHGNNKTLEELQMALNFKIGFIVLDNPFEAKLLMGLVNEHYIPKVMLRINPGIDAHTHEYIKTSKLDSKFGVSIEDKEVFEIIYELSQHPYIDFIGTHSHIGSQILEEKSFIEHAKTVLNFYKDVKARYNIELNAVNLGGGFGVKYLKDDIRLDLEKVLPMMLDSIYETANQLGIIMPHVMIEPGRSIVAEAGYTLYTINQTKETINHKKYIFIDGSMNDHIRTALYQAKYDCLIVDKENHEHNTLYTVAGKACESGDIIIHDILLPKANPGDLLLVKTTGAYHYSMASNYNRLTIPAVVFLSKGKDKLIVKRQSMMDLIQYDEVL